MIESQYPAARQLVVEFAKTVPLKPKYFGHLRHLYKAAEFRQDGQIFGIIAKRLEKTSPYYQRPTKGNKVYVDREWLLPTTEYTSATPKLAFSNKTQTYLNKRVLRTLHVHDQGARKKFKSDVGARRVAGEGNHRGVANLAKRRRSPGPKPELANVESKPKLA